MRQSGFTIVELVIVILLTLVVGIVVSTLFIGQNRVYQTETAELNITNDARTGLDDIDNYVRQAYRALQSYSSYTAGSQVLILQIQSVGASTQLIPGTYDYVVYYLTGNNLYRQVYPDAASTRSATTKKIASNVNSLAFTYSDPDFALVTTVSTAMTLQQDVGCQTRSITLSSSSKLRNY